MYGLAFALESIFIQVCCGNNSSTIEENSSRQAIMEGWLSFLHTI
jgi:hypothetical protein